MLIAYVPYTNPDGLFKKNNRKLYDKIVAVKNKLGILGAEEMLGISFPYTAAEYNTALYTVFPSDNMGNMTEDDFAFYYAVQDLLRDDGTPRGDVLAHTIDDEEWLRDRYGDEYYEAHYKNNSEDSWLRLIRSLKHRRHISSATYGDIYDTGIRGTLLSFTEQDVELFLQLLAEYGPFAFILDEPDDGIYNVACIDSPYHLFNGIWDRPTTNNEYIRELRGVDTDNTHVEYMIANTITILENFGLNYDEIEAFLQGNPDDYNNNVDWYMVNHYRSKSEQYWPFK